MKAHQTFHPPRIARKAFAGNPRFAKARGIDPRAPAIARKARDRATNYLLLLAGVLGAALAALFYKSFLPHQVLFANDGSLGAMMAECNHLPGRFLGTWRNLWWIGTEAPAAAPGVSAIFETILPPVFFLKIYAPATLLFVGFSAWVFFRQLEFNPAVCVIGGIAAGLNMHFFSTACWGLGTWNVSAGMIFLALAALCRKRLEQKWAKAVLAGLAVGVNLMEGFDVGAILSLYVGLFVLFRAFSEEAGFAKKTLAALVTEGLVIFFAGLIGAHTIDSLVGTQIEGVTGTKQDAQTKEQQWDFATWWSLPKVETLRLITPGLFGYGMAENITSADKSSAYWGNVGQDPRIQELKSGDARLRAKALAQIGESFPLWAVEKKGMESSDPDAREAAADSIILRSGMVPRQSGTGEYAGVLVTLLAVFALANSCRGPQAPFSPAERRVVWFMGMAALVSILAAWGRHGFLYSMIYRLPYFSNIRNPIKFLQPFHIVWLILAGFGLEVLHRRYLQNPFKRTGFLPGNIKEWWCGAEEFEQRWVGVCALVLAAALAGWAALFFSWDSRLVPYLEGQGASTALSSQMAVFCVGEMAWFLGFLVLSMVVLTGILSGAWSGPRAKTGWIYLGAILILDLGRSDLPWIHYFDYQEKYSRNAVTDFLTGMKPYDQRVMGRLSPRGAGSSLRGEFGRMYNYWMQNDFPYREIQTLDIPQMPRVPEMDDAYMRNFELRFTNLDTADLRPAARLWELTGTRYLFLEAGMAPLLNEHGDPAWHGFHVLATLGTEPKPVWRPAEDGGDLTVYPDTNGETALIEYNHVLPRAKLFAHWETPANGEATLAALASPDFIPAQTVLLWTNSAVAQASGEAKTDAGSVEITDYHPKDIKLRATAKAPAVLLLNERYSPTWSVWVDQKPARLLRCNYIMRGVFLPPGEHTVEFRYRASLTTLFLSLSGWAAGLLTAGYLGWRGRSKEGK
jgi:hypothetical protein